MATETSLKNATRMTEKDHEHLGQLIDQIRHLLEKHSAVAKETATAMETLRRHVASHFAMEEESPLFRDTGDQAAWFRQPVKQLLQQHRTLRDQAAQLAEWASRQQPLPEGWAEFAVRFSQFGQDLLDHEHSEIEIFQRAYNEDIGTKD